MSTIKTYYSYSEWDTERLGRAFGQALGGGGTFSRLPRKWKIFVRGDFGSGKSTLSRAICKAFVGNYDYWKMTGGTHVNVISHSNRRQVRSADAMNECLIMACLRPRKVYGTEKPTGRRIDFYEHALPWARGADFVINVGKKYIPANRPGYYYDERAIRVKACNEQAEDVIRKLG